MVVVWSEGDVGFVDGLGGFGFEILDLGSGTFEVFVLPGLASEGIKVAIINCGPMFSGCIGV